MNDTQHIPHDDLALYAMQALSPEERDAVRRHVDQCGECAAELARLEGDLATLALTVEEQPLPPGARERFANRIAAEAQHVSSPGGKVTDISSPRRSRAAVSTWIPWTAVAALLLVAVALGVEVASLRQALSANQAQMAQMEERNSRAQRVVEALTAPTAQHVLLTAAKTPPTPSARAIYLPARGSLIFQASNLAPLPKGKTYELWVIPAGGAAPIPAGLFQADASGNGSVVLPDIPTGIRAKAFGVTMESAGGAQTPTAPILLAGAVPDNGE